MSETTLSAHEERRMVRVFLGILVGVVLLSALAFLSATGAELILQEKAEEEQPLEHPRFQGPLLEPSSGVELERLREEEKALLEGYGWVDRDRGVVHIPIDRAIERTVGRAWSARTSTAAHTHERGGQ